MEQRLLQHCCRKHLSKYSGRDSQPLRQRASSWDNTDVYCKRTSIVYGLSDGYTDAVNHADGDAVQLSDAHDTAAVRHEPVAAVVRRPMGRVLLGLWRHGRADAPRQLPAARRRLPAVRVRGAAARRAAGVRPLGGLVLGRVGLVDVQRELRRGRADARRRVRGIVPLHRA